MAYKTNENRWAKYRSDASEDDAASKMKSSSNNENRWSKYRSDNSSSSDKISTDIIIPSTEQPISDNAGRLNALMNHEEQQGESVSKTNSQNNILGSQFDLSSPMNQLKAPVLVTDKQTKISDAADKWKKQKESDAVLEEGLNKLKAGDLSLPEPEKQEIATKSTSVLPGITRPFTKKEKSIYSELDEVQTEINDIADTLNGIGYTSEKQSEKERLLVDCLNAAENKKTELQAKLFSEAYPGIPENVLRYFVEIQNKNTENAEYNPNISDYASYTLSQLGMGAESTIRNLTSGIMTTLGDAATGGKYSDGYKKISDYISENGLDFTSFIGPVREYNIQKLSDKVGVPKEVVESYLESTHSENQREAVGDYYSNLSEWYTNEAGISPGNIAYSIGGMIPGILLTAGGNTATQNTISALKSAKNIKDVSSVFGKAVSNDFSSLLIGGSVYGSTINDLAKERGFNTSNYINGIAQGATEYILEKSLGFSDAQSFQNLVVPTGSKAVTTLKGILKYIATGSEEGLEELLNEPLSEIIDRMTGVSDRTNIIGDGGIFDIKQMLESGLNGALCGWFLGASGAIVSSAADLQESQNISEEFNQLKRVNNGLPDEYKIAELDSVDPKKLTFDQAMEYHAKEMEQLRNYLVDIESGKISPQTEREFMKNKETTSTADNDKTSPTYTAAGNDVDTLSDKKQTPAPIFGRSDSILTQSENNVNNENSGSIDDSDPFRVFSNESIKIAYENASINPDTAAKELLKANSGSVKKSIDELIRAAGEINRSNISDKQSVLNVLKSVDKSIRTNNQKIVSEEAFKLKSKLSRYGINNVVVDTSGKLASMDMIGIYGYYDRKSNIIHLSPYLDSDATIISTAVHEFTHHGATYDTSLVDDIMQVVPKAIENGVIINPSSYNRDLYIKTYDDEIQSYLNTTEEASNKINEYINNGMTYEQARQKVYDDYINEEMAAHFISDLVKTNTEIQKDFVQQNRNIFQRILDAITSLIERLRGKEDVRMYERASELIRNILETETGFKTNVGNIDKSSVERIASDDTIRYSEKLDTDRYDYSKSFEKQIDDYLAGKLPKYDTLVVSETPEVFRQIGLNGLPMTYGTGHLAEVMKGTSADHNFGIDNLKKLPEALKRPIAIIASNTRPNSSVAAILDLSYNEKPMFAAVEIDGFGQLNGNRINSNAITTVHTRKNAANMLNKALEAESNGQVSVFYVDKEKTNRFLNASGVQFPGGTSLSDGYIHSIYDKGSPVNTKFESVTKTKQFKRWFGDWEKHPNNASKVVNEDGTPKIMYHGTRAENGNFTVFDYSKAVKKGGLGLKAMGKGNYFTSTQLTGQERFGPRVIKAYLDIKQPFIYEGGSSFTEQVSTAIGYDVTGVSSDELQDIMRKNGYDGVLYYDNDGLAVAVTFDSNQIKSATDNIGTFDAENPDIRYNRELDINDFDRGSIIAKLQDENEYLKRQFTARNGEEWAKAVSPSDMNRISKTIAKTLPGVSASEVKEEIDPVISILQRKITSAYSSTKRYEDAKNAARLAAMKLINRTKIVSINEDWLDIRDLKKKLRETKIYVDETIRSEFSDWSKIRKELSGSLSITTTDISSLQVDSFYSELSEEYPEYFSPDITVPQQQMERIIEVSNQLKDIKQYKYENLWVDSEQTGNLAIAERENNELVESFANSILSEYNSASAETLAAQLEKEKSENKWDSNSTRNMIAELEKSILSAEREGYERGIAEGERRTNQIAEDDAKRIIDLYMRQTRRASNAFMELYNQQLGEFHKELERANKEAERAKNHLVHKNERTELSAARKSFSKKLDRIYRDLVNPTDKKHVPDGLRDAVTELLMNFSGQKLDNGKTIDSELLRKLSTKNAMEKADMMSDSLGRLEHVVRQNKNSADFNVSDSFINEMSDSIAHARETLNESKYISKQDLKNEIDYYASFGKDYYAQRELYYLNQCNKILSMVQKYINDSNKVFINGKTEFAADMANEAAKNIGKRPVKEELPGRKTIGKNSKPGKIVYDYMTPDTFWHMFGGFGDKIIKSYRKAQNVQASREEEYAKYVKEIFEKEKGFTTYDTGFNGKLITITVDGKSFDVTRSQLMQCWVTWKRPAGRRHMKDGGVYFSNKSGEESESRRVIFTDSAFNDVMKNLSDSDKKIAESIAKFLSVRCASWGNDASMYLYGYKKFMDDHYFPIISAKTALPKNWDSIDNYSRLENKGMTKSIKEDAKNAVVITDFFDVVDKHVRDMAAYAAYAPVNNDVTRIFNMGIARNAMSTSLGKDGERYLDGFLKTINQNKVRDAEFLTSSIFMRIFTNLYKRQAVSANLSTALKQPLSYVRAWNSIDAKYLVKAFYDKSILPNSKSYNQLYNEMTEYSGVAKMKVLGYSDVGFGKSLRSIYDKKYSVSGDRYRSKTVREILKVYENASEAGMWLAGKMDEWTWVRLWKACDLQVNAEQTKLNYSDRMRAIAEKFNQVIGETQVVDTILDTPPIIKSESMNHFTAFMNEPIKTLNSIYVAIDGVRTSQKGSLERKSANEKMAKSFASYVVSSMILEPVVSALFSMFRDEENEEGILWEKFWNLMIGTKCTETEDWSVMDVLTSEVVSSIYGGVPVITDIIETILNSIQGFDNERMDTAGLSKLVQSAVSLSKYDPEKSQKTLGNLTADTISSFASLFGLPGNTLKRDIIAGYRKILQISNNHVAQWELNKSLYNLQNGTARTQKNFYDIVARVIEDNDTEAYKYIRNDLSNVFSSTTKGISANDMMKAMEKKNNKIEVGSKVWYIELQANFNLPSFNTNMQVEQLITSVYKQTEDSSVLPKSPVNSFSVPSNAKFSSNLQYKNEDDKGEKSRTVMFKNDAEYAKYTEDVGYFSYMTLVSYASSSVWNKLNNEQKTYAIKQAYKFAQDKYKQKLCEEYNINNELYEKLCKKNATPDAVAQAILKEAKHR